MIKPILMVLSVSVLGIVALSMPANAAPLPTEKFCFGTGPDPFSDVNCYKGLGTCQKAEDDFITNGGTVTASCHNVYKHVKP